MNKKATLFRNLFHNNNHSIFFSGLSFKPIYARSITLLNLWSLLLLFTFSAASSALDIVIEPGIGEDIDPDILEAAEQAAAAWEEYLGDPVIVRVELRFDNDLDPLSVNTPARVDIVDATASYELVRDALRLDATSFTDIEAFSSLEPGRFSFITNDIEVVNGVRLFEDSEDENIRLDSQLEITTANAKALFLLSDNGSFDGHITLNRHFNFDTNPLDGIDSDAIDLVYLLTHELGHILGFRSGVEAIDSISESNGPFKEAEINLDVSNIFSVLDLFRYSDESILHGFTEGTRPARDLSTWNSPYLMFKKGVGTGLFFSTGMYNGNGVAAGHWTSEVTDTIMGPPLGFGRTAKIGDTDLRAFDAIGWNINPLVIGTAPAIKTRGQDVVVVVRFAFDSTCPIVGPIEHRVEGNIIVVNAIVTDLGCFPL